MAHWSSVDVNDGTNAKATVLRVTTMKFVETAAGTYTGACLMPADALLYDIVVHNEVASNATTSSLKVGDAVTADGYFTAVDMKATDLVASTGESINFYAAGGQQGADLDDVAVIASHVRRRRLTGTRTISAVLTTTGAGAAGRSWVDVLWASMPSGDRVAPLVVV